MSRTSKLSFDVDILAYFWLDSCFGFFSKPWEMFYQLSGHRDCIQGAKASAAVVKIAGIFINKILLM
jgi:hypothetical protein